MTQPAPVRFPPLRLSRVLHAPRATVFRAWCDATHVRQWFCPASFTVPEASVDARPGGVFDVCMRAPQGETHWIRGTFRELVRDTRLVIAMTVTDAAGKALFGALTEAEFTDTLGGTKLDLVQTYTLIDPEAAWMLDGAPQGWDSTLDKLEAEVIRLQSGGVPGSRSVVHATFHLQRCYPAPLARVWRALTDPAAKQAWFAGTPGKWELLDREMDVRVGGRERLKGRWEGGVVSDFEATYHDVVPHERLVYSYVMHLDDRKISVSLATLQLQADGDGTILKVSEQGAFLDGYDDAGSREQGTGFLLDALGASLAA